MPSSSTKSSAPAANPDGPATKIDISSKKSKGELTKRAKLIAVGVGVAVLLVISGGIYGYLKWSAAKELETKIANLLGVSLDLSGLVEKAPRIAFIKESLCIGCCKCFKRCPTDAIMGANNMIHSVFTDACIGCEQCFAVCPTECIEMRPLVANLQTWFWPNPTALAAAP